MQKRNVLILMGFSLQEVTFAGANISECRQDDQPTNAQASNPFLADKRRLYSRHLRALVLALLEGFIIRTPVAHYLFAGSRCATDPLPMYRQCLRLVVPVEYITRNLRDEWKHAVNHQ
jgi:hypothetical protein